MLRWFLGLPFRVLFSVLRVLSAPRVLRARSGDEAAIKYISLVESLHGTDHLPLSSCSYDKAVEKAKQDLRFLLVVLTSEVHSDTPTMMKLLGDKTLQNYIGDNNILVWAGNVAEVEAYQTGKKLGASRYPFMGLVVYNTARGSKMTCVSKLEGLPTNIELMSLIQESLDKYSPTLISLKADRREQNFAREIRAEQDSAYEISLRKDREKAELARRQKEEQERAEHESIQRAQDITRWRAWKAHHLPSEPTGSGNLTRISFRMPDGSRCIRKFSADSTLEDIYTWIDLRMYAVESSSSQIEPPSPEYKHSFGFTLAVPMPRKLLSPDPQTVSNYSEIYPSGSLIVEMLED